MWLWMTGLKSIIRVTAQHPAFLHLRSLAAAIISLKVPAGALAPQQEGLKSKILRSAPSRDGADAPDPASPKNRMGMRGKLEV